MVIVEECNTDPCVGPGEWGEWSEWLKCTATCSGGQKRRFRGCVGGMVGLAGDGCDDGPAEEIENCNTEPCPDESPCEVSY